MDGQKVRTTTPSSGIHKLLYVSLEILYVKARSHRACDHTANLSVTERIGNHIEVAEVAARFYKARNEVAAGSPIGRR